MELTEGGVRGPQVDLLLMGRNSIARASEVSLSTLRVSLSTYSASDLAGVGRAAPRRGSRRHDTCKWFGTGTDQYVLDTNDSRYWTGDQGECSLKRPAVRGRGLYSSCSSTTVC